VRFLVEQPGLNIDAVDLDGMSALHWAVWAGQPDIVQLLLDKGANPLLLVPPPPPDNHSTRHDTHATRHATHATRHTLCGFKC
jgi:ankyrin repeat protein